MKPFEQSWSNQGFLLRPACSGDALDYYQQNFNPLDPEIVRLTGCKNTFSKEEVISFFLQCLEDGSRYDFLIIAPEGRIIGESVINEIDWSVRSANFRIAIFHPEECGRGIGSWAIKMTRDFAFEHLKLHRLELDVFSFNIRAQKAYAAAGFRQEGILRDAVWNGTEYADDILMAILEDDWKKLVSR